MTNPSILEKCPSPSYREDLERRQELLAQLVEPDHIHASPLPPATKIYPPMHNALAIRDDTSQFDVRQILYGIIRAGDHGFGIVGAYGDKLPPHGGLLFLTRLTPDPYRSRPIYAGHLNNGKSVSIGGESGLFADLRTEHSFTVSRSRYGNIAIQGGYTGGRRRVSTPFELISGELSDLRAAESIVAREVGIWAPPPDLVQRQARKAGLECIDFRKKARSRGKVSVVEQQRGSAAGQKNDQKKRTTYNRAAAKSAARLAIAEQVY